MPANGDGAMTDPAVARVLEGTPVTNAASTLPGVDLIARRRTGTPIVLLHGQGGFAAHWLQVIPTSCGAIGS